MMSRAPNSYVKLREDDGLEYIDFEKKFIPRFFEKGWGGELWLVNSSEYCGKVLIFNQGKKCSWHFHIKKVETFHVLKGRVQILTGKEDNLSFANSTVLDKGESLHIPVGMRHQIIALENSEVLEISTYHDEEDSYRLVKGD